MKDKIDVAENIAVWYKNLLGDDFYLEIQDHGSIEDRIVNVGLIKIANKLKIKVIATNDSHYISNYDVESHDALLCIGEKTYVDEANRKKYSDQHFIRPNVELKRLYSDIPEALENNFETCYFRIYRRYHYIVCNCQRRYCG